MTNPYNAIPYAAQFGSSMASLIGQPPTEGGTPQGFASRQAGGDYKQQMGGAAGIAGAAGGLASSVMGGVGKIQEGKAMKEAGLTATGRKMQAQAGLDMAASAAEMGGPIGGAIAMPLKLISMLLSIKGPRAKRQEREAKERARVKGRHASMRAANILAGTAGAAGQLRTGGNMPAQPSTVTDPTPATPAFTGVPMQGR